MVRGQRIHQIKNQNHMVVALRRTNRARNSRRGLHGLSSRITWSKPSRQIACNRHQQRGAGGGGLSGWKFQFRGSELESALLEWFLQHECDGPINGECLREKARKIYTLIYPNHEVPQLKFANRWLRGFKRRHGIKDITVLTHTSIRPIHQARYLI